MLKFRRWSLLILLAAVITACSSNQGSNPPPEGSGQAAEQPSQPSQPAAPPEPVKLSVYVDLPAEFSEEEITRYLREPLAKKHPHITIDGVIFKGTGTQREQMIASGTFPDLIYTSITWIPDFMNLDLAQNITDLAKKHQFDFNALYGPLVVKNLTTLSGDGTYRAMPFSSNRFATYYNKDIFDRFGIAYPRDLMTWDEGLELAKQLTRSVDGTQYVGLDAHSMAQAAWGLSLVHVDPVTLKSNYHTEGFRKVFQLFQTLYNIPGHINEKGEVAWASAGFFQNKNVAMLTGPLNVPRMIASLDDPLRWDITTIFNFAEALGTEREADMHVLMMSSMSKNKDAAFQSLALTASKEVQLDMARNVRMPATLTFDQFKDVFAESQPRLKEKNFAGVFKATPREISVRTKYHTAASNVFNSARGRLSKDKIDINTLMRELQEKADMAIEQEKAK